jgi:hypothetical protein
MARISEVDQRCEDERRARLELERRAARAEDELRAQAELAARAKSEAMARESALLNRVAQLELGQTECRDALEALCDTVEWSATNDSVVAQIGDLEQLILEHVEGVETAVRTDISARLDTHEDLLNELGTEVDNLPRSAQEMVDELRQAATGVLDEQAASLAELEPRVKSLEVTSTRLESDTARVQTYLHEDLEKHLGEIGQKFAAAEEIEVRRVKHVHDEVESLGVQVGRTEASHIAAMEDVALAVAASNRQCEEMRQFIDQTQSDLQVHELSHKMALEDVHSKLELIEDPSGFLDRLQSLTSGAASEGAGGKKDSSEIARAIDFILERVTKLEHHRDSSVSQQDDAASISQIVDAKLLAVARKLEVHQAAIMDLKTEMQQQAPQPHQQMSQGTINRLLVDPTRAPQQQQQVAAGAGNWAAPLPAQQQAQAPATSTGTLSGIGLSRLEEVAAARGAVAAPPPPPPAPPAAAPPPPPPLGAPPPASPAMPAGSRGELLSAISSGASLNRVETVEKTAGASAHDGLLFAIGRGTAADGLKQVETVEKTGGGGVDVCDRQRPRL